MDIELPYKPTGRQSRAHAVMERFVLYGGAVGGGESVWLCNEGIQLSLDYPGNVGYLGKVEDSIGEWRVALHAQPNMN
jgi:hypothetical protein